MLYLLSDMGFRIKTAVKRKCGNVIVLNSKFCLKTLTFIYFLGYIAGLKILGLKFLKVLLKYKSDQSSTLRFLSILSKKHYKAYLTVFSLRRSIFKNRFLLNGFFICSCSYKSMLATDVECSMLNIGGVGVIYVS